MESPKKTRKQSSFLRDHAHCSKVLVGGHPDGLVGVVDNDFFDFLVQGIDVVALDNGREVLHELALQPAKIRGILRSRNTGVEEKNCKMSSLLKVSKWIKI